MHTEWMMAVNKNPRKQRKNMMKNRVRCGDYKEIANI